MTNNNEHWNTVDWSQIPEDVEAVVTFKDCHSSYYKVTNGELFCSCYRGGKFFPSNGNTFKVLLDDYGNRFHLRPTPPANKVDDQPITTEVEFYEGILPEGMIDLDNFHEVKDNPSDLRLQCRSNILNSKPSIQSILSDAQELIKKHHNITGEVKFTIKCQQG